jgi:hypothetical protein
VYQSIVIESKLMRGFRFVWLYPLLLSVSVGEAASAQSQWANPEEIEHFLREARITDRKKIGEGITNPEKVTLELDGVVRYAVYKKVDKDHDSWRNEVAAYELDKLLGLGMVPPTVPRSIHGRKGCLQLWVTGTTMSKFEGTFPDIERWREQVSVMWLFDDLTANIDRHLNNAMIAPDYRLMLIDNSKTFRYQKTLLNDLNATGTGTNARFWGVAYDANRERYETRYPRSLIERLRKLSEKDIANAIKPYIWGQDRDLVLERRTLILSRVDSMGAGVLESDSSPLSPDRPHPSAR